MIRPQVLIALTLMFFLSSFNAMAEKLSVATIERAPFSGFDDNKQRTGFSVELWQDLAKRADLDFEWTQYQQFSKMIDSVNKDNIDLAIANISITAARELEADFSYPIFASGMAIAVKKGGKSSFISLIWESGILLFLAGAFFILLVIAHIVWFFERDVEDARHDYFRDDYFGGIWDAFWWAFVIMTMGGFENQVPNKVFNRVVAMFWIITSLFFISTLTAKITTALTVAELQTGINSYNDLKHKRVGVTNGSSHEKFMKSKGFKTIGYATLDELYADLKADELDAVIADYPILSYYQQQGGGSWMQMAGSVFNTDNYGMIFPENSPYLEKINTMLLEYKEDGSYARLKNKYFGK